MDIVYVTVGTTRFDSLIKEITSDAAMEVLKNRGCKKLILQHGTGKGLCDKEILEQKYGIQIDQYDFKHEPIRKDILNSTLTIGHAGAGTCMDILHLKKPGILVTNEDLMDNHQTELAEQMATEGFIYNCKVKNLAQTLRTFDFGNLKEYIPNENMPEFIRSLNKLMS